MSTVPPPSQRSPSSIPPSSDARGALAKSEVKGVWFTTARRYVLETAGEDALAAMSHRVDRAYRELVLDPFPSEWYPERALQQALSAMHVIVAGGDDDAFIDVMAGCTRLGIHHFFRALMRMSSPSVILKKTPAMWNHIRRGAGQVAVEADEASATIRYSEFPFFRDPNYRLLTLGAIRALVNVCGGEVRSLEVPSFAWDAMTVRVVYGG